MGMVELLDDNGVFHKEKGKNITAGWININCPHCGDSANHCGYNPQGSYFSCWKCGHHTMESTLMKILKVPYDTLRLICRQYDVPLTQRGSVDTIHHTREIVIDDSKLAKYTPIGGDLLARHKRYLIGRGLSWRRMQREFKVRGTPGFGKYSNRIVIPVIYEGKEVSWVSRSILENPSVRYINCPKEEEIINLKDTLFNMDNTGSSVIVTEGPLDAMALGYGAVSTLSCAYTPIQVELLRNYSRVFIFYDPDKSGMRAAYKLASELGSNISVEILKSDLDPSELWKSAPNEIRKLKRDLLI